ncbi:MAG: HDOD domain-containing protein [Nitrospiraceae bacterium]
MSALTHDEVRSRIEQLGDLPTLPHIVQKLAATIGRENVSAEDIGSLIEKDQVLSAKVLRLANSPLYGFPARIASVAHAVVVLGLNVVKGLTLCASAFDMMKDAGMTHLWRHSLGVAMTSHILATRAHLRNPEELFVAGLMHDIGKVVLCVKWPDTAAKLTQGAAKLKDKDPTILEVEQAVLSLSHADVGGALAQAWHLPTSLREPILYHHYPTLARDAAQQTAIVHVADVIVKAMGCGNPGDDMVPVLSQPAWEMVGLNDKALAECLEQASGEFLSIDDYL